MKLSICGSHTVLLFVLRPYVDPDEGPISKSINTEKNVFDHINRLMAIIIRKSPKFCGHLFSLDLFQWTFYRKVRIKGWRTFFLIFE